MACCLDANGVVKESLYYRYSYSIVNILVLNKCANFAFYGGLLFSTVSGKYQRYVQKFKIQTT